MSATLFLQINTTEVNVHAALISKFQKVLDNLETLNTKEAIKHIADMLIISASHFKEEELIMEKVKYPLLVIHRMVHEDILFKLKGLITVIDLPLEKIEWLINSIKFLLENHNEQFDNTLEEFITTHL